MSRRPKTRPVVLLRDHARPRTCPAPAVPEVEARLTDLLRPEVVALGTVYRQQGLRDRRLTLPVMVAVVLTMIWRQVPSVTELGRLLAREGLLWASPLAVSQQALSLRLRCLPAALFARILADLVPRLRDRATARTRPRPAIIARAQVHFTAIWAVDGTTLEALFKKVGLLRGVPGPVHGGTLEAVLDLATKLPVHLWLDPDPAANDKRFLDRIKAVLPVGGLVVVDRGFYSFPCFDWLTAHERWFVTRARSLTALQVARTLVATPTLRDRIIRLGQYRSNPCQHPVRLIEVEVGGRWRRYLTNVCDPAVLSAADVVDLYGRRWKIEDAFLLTKRLLGLSYLWSGAFNAIALQVWATWALYAALVDLTDAVAEELDQPLDALSVEMVYRGLYHFSVAAQAGIASDPVAYLADPANRDLGIVKRRRKHRERTHLDASPPDLNL
jgi:hypothetical protein